MLRHEKSAPIWLFSFVDLAFLLLIAFTQIGLEQASTDGPIVQLEIPQIQGPGTPIEGSASKTTWQLRVHPTLAKSSAENGGEHAPFELLEPGRQGEAAQTTRSIDSEALAAQLRILATRAVAKPVLAPHRDSRSEDLLVAVALLDEVWHTGRAVAVRPGPLPAVAARIESSPAQVSAGR